jgi:diguanylate cyclase (GGDEF)-like protein
MSSGYPTANFSDSQQGLFTPDEIQQLMRIEYERALRYEYPISLMVVGVDRLDYLHDLYGYESREEILQAVVGQLRSITRASDFLGCMVDDRMMALFPHTEERASDAIAGRLLRGTRSLTFESGGRTLRVTLSAGITTATPGGEASFEEFAESAQDGLAFAMEWGGDRYARREAASDLIENLREELEVEAQLLREQQKSLGTPLPVIVDLPTRSVEERIHEIFQARPEGGGDLEDLEHRIVAAATRCVETARERAVTEKVEEYSTQVDILERRVTKLKDLLDTTEVELQRVAALKGVDSGIASVYRSVQGLSEGEDDFDRKKEILAILFEANVRLRKEIEGRG